MENLIDTLDGVLELAQDSTIKVMGVGGGGCNCRFGNPLAPRRMG